MFRFRLMSRSTASAVRKVLALEAACSKLQLSNPQIVQVEAKFNCTKRKRSLHCSTITHSNLYELTCGHKNCMPFRIQCFFWPQQSRRQISFGQTNWVITFACSASLTYYLDNNRQSGQLKSNLESFRTVPNFFLKKDIVHNKNLSYS